MNRRAGQAAVELVAAVPILLAAGLVVWQLAAALWAGVQVQERLREEALQVRTGTGIVTVTARVPVPALAPPLAGLEVRSRAGVRAP